MEKIERKLMAHFLADGEGSYSRLGKDLEELDVSLNPEVNTTLNILGESNTLNSGYAPEADVSPYYAYKDDPLFEWLQEGIDTRNTDMTSTAVEVHLWASSGTGSTTFEAYKEDCLVVPQSYGGDTSAYRIEFNVYYTGNRVAGTFDITTKKFTAGGNA